MTARRSPTLVTLGRLVRAHREAAGLTQKELASRLGYTNGWVSNVGANGTAEHPCQGKSTDGARRAG
ncbi:helix-turn-helix domain-containing protein [Actinoallomurus iriomotensis]|uniref:helix-turn-helix domain-containing protein n=1 Tax=Actinoallomurus iriomotensis TaxID=478107 RepID=UPI003D7F4D82